MREITKTLTIPVDGKKTDFRLTKLKTRGRFFCLHIEIDLFNSHRSQAGI